MGLKEWFWSLLPDNCDMDECCRKGMLGNENVINNPVWGNLTICDYCTSRLMRGDVLKAKYPGLPGIHRSRWK